jgi:1-deoxy-D-xylulose-5-phosphate reductoisomerase
MKRITILGATGSIGSSTLDVVERNPDLFRVHALTADTSVDRLLELSLRHAPRYAVISGLPESGTVVRKFSEAGCASEVLFGRKALEDVAADPDSDIVVAGIVGAAGLAPTLAGASRGKRLLLANKEALVMAGGLFMDHVTSSGAELLPIDSEHNAVFQCFPHVNAPANVRKSVRRVMLTASGGPFRSTPLEALANVTPQQACAHPNWVMGRKISVDSATMFNKGLEVIEARWLFAVAPEQIEVLIHPQSIVHSMVEYQDGSVLAQLSNPDMRVPIAHALGFPQRIPSGTRPLDLAQLGSLTFEKPDASRFPCLGIAYEALAADGTAPAILNAANEVAVEAFLSGRIRYLDIPDIIRGALDEVDISGAFELPVILDADRQAREVAHRGIARLRAPA